MSWLRRWFGPTEPTPDESPLVFDAPVDVSPYAPDTPIPAADAVIVLPPPDHEFAASGDPAGCEADDGLWHGPSLDDRVEDTIITFLSTSDTRAYQRFHDVWWNHDDLCLLVGNAHGDELGDAIGPAVDKAIAKLRKKGQLVWDPSGYRAR